MRHLELVLDDTRTQAVRRQIRRDVGALVPPFLLHLPSPAALCAYWAIVREPTHGIHVSRARKEAVAAAVSAINACPYCVEVHTTVLHALGVDAQARDLAGGRGSGSSDPELDALIAWARATRDPDAAILRQPPFADHEVAELIGVAVSYHYINRMVALFVVPSPFLIKWAPLKAGLRRLAVLAFARQTRHDVRPGAAVQLLPPSSLPDDLGWARGNAVIADAFGRAAAAFDAAGANALPEPVRSMVTEWVTVWRGEDPGLSRAWLEDAVRPLATDHRPLGRLTLLTALAPYQIDERLIGEARAHLGPAADEPLVAACAWASFTAARRVGTWLAPPRRPQPRGQKRMIARAVTAQEKRDHLL
ncbi:carboxymuconolactone decarboxylase family protein [Actinopolymorpha pittospori]|uniref:AhpD family alkylhydroperoxidase n=1 Tax=Actinopolymorpha pittospori TaxID=648752 RepID=A0A927MU69_9ACTN|nr:AhpD family alkylhydroperoxidase [Actinopolymorpha pittospori]